MSLKELIRQRESFPSLRTLTPALSEESPLRIRTDPLIKLGGAPETRGAHRAVPDPLSPTWTSCLKTDSSQPGLPKVWAFCDCSSNQSLWLRTIPHGAAGRAPDTLTAGPVSRSKRFPVTQNILQSQHCCRCFTDEEPQEATRERLALGQTSNQKQDAPGPKSLAARLRGPSALRSTWCAAALHPAHRAVRMSPGLTRFCRPLAFPAAL